ncbi:hypothetical protein WJX77_001010 [Trebouxia sp. C0004]
MSQAVNEYEQQRLDNIARNNARKLTKEKYPHLAIQRCMMHGFALIMGSVFGHSWAVNILKQCQKLKHEAELTGSKATAGQTAAVKIIKSKVFWFAKQCKAMRYRVLGRNADGRDDFKVIGREAVEMLRARKLSQNELCPPENLAMYQPKQLRPTAAKATKKQRTLGEADAQPLDITETRILRSLDMPAKQMSFVVPMDVVAIDQNCSGPYTLGGLMKALSLQTMRLAKLDKNENVEPRIQDPESDAPSQGHGLSQSKAKTAWSKGRTGQPVRSTRQSKSTAVQESKTSGEVQAKTKGAEQSSQNCVKISRTLLVAKCSGTTYTIKSGDTLSDLATGCTVQDILAVNPKITNPNSIAAGASLCLPSSCNTGVTGTLKQSDKWLKVTPGSVSANSLQGSGEAAAPEGM